MTGISWFFLISLTVGGLGGLLAKGGWLGMVGDVTIGAVVGGFLFDSVGTSPIGFWGSLLMATIGGTILIVLLRVVRRV